MGPEYLYTYNRVGKKLGKGASGDSHDELQVSASGIVFGISADINGGLKLGPGRFYLNLRYIWDLTPIKGKQVNSGDIKEILYRRFISLGGGYSFAFSL